MSIDPVAAVGGADLAALLDAELASLAADAQALRDLLVEGSVVTATILPSNGLTDLIRILDLRVPAALPPNVRPGDVVQVRVTGFEGDQVQVQLLGPAAADPAAETPASPAPAPGAFVPASIRPAAPSSGTAPLRSATPVPSAAPTAVEARLAAQAASAPRVMPAVPQPPATPAGARLQDARLPDAPVPPRPAAPFVAPPQVAVRTAPRAVPAAPRPSGLAAYQEPVALLRALRLPVTPSTVASATLALARPERLPQALATLARALPPATGDAHVATLRTLLAFVGRIEPESPVLAAQVAAFVDHVVDGAEPKLATFLAATDAVRAADRAPASPTPAAPAANAPSAPPDAAPVANAAVQPPAAAIAAERGAALGADLKQTMLVVAADPATPPAASDALAGALSALTAVQADAARLLAAQPDGLAFTIPLATQFGPRDARISISREAPQQRGVPLDGENFRVTFVLDTANVGTVAVDLVTVGREVTVDVRAENAAATRAFRDALGTLTTRLESLRYRVASAEAKLGTPTIVERTP